MLMMTMRRLRGSSSQRPESFAELCSHWDRSNRFRDKIGTTPKPTHRSKHTMAGVGGFEPGPRDPKPFSFDVHVRPPRDPFAILDGEPLARLTAVRQRKLDWFVRTPTFEEVREARDSVTRYQNRIAALTKKRGEGGPGLDENASQVFEERRMLERAEKELARLTTLKDTRSARATVAGQLERAVSDWLLEGGVPGNCELEAIADPPLSELLIKADGGRIDAAVARYRREVEGHAEILQKLRASFFTKAEVDALIADQINSLADAAAPDISRAAQFLEPVKFATAYSQKLAPSLDPKAPPAIVGSEAIDSLGLLCWMFRSEMIAKLQGMVTENRAAISQSEREAREAQIGGLMLEAERAECSLIFHAERKGEIIDFRVDTSPQALLGVRLVTRPHADPSPGTSEGHAYDIVGVRR
jgi:hypothetical protein